MLFAYHQWLSLYTTSLEQARLDSEHHAVILQLRLTPGMVLAGQILKCNLTNAVGCALADDCTSYW